MLHAGTDQKEIKDFFKTVQEYKKERDPSGLSHNHLRFKFKYRYKYLLH